MPASLVSSAGNNSDFFHDVLPFLIEFAPNFLTDHHFCPAPGDAAASFLKELEMKDDNSFRVYFFGFI